LEDYEFGIICFQETIKFNIATLMMSEHL